jgi:hypothetical protein
MAARAFRAWNIAVMAGAANPLVALSAAVGATYISRDRETAIRTCAMAKLA